MTLSAGKRLGPYEILSPLGAGGMGEVYKARDVRLDRWIALKILPPEVASDPDRLRRFEQEARAASALNHPNILSVYDVGSVDSTSYIVTELVEGRTLRDLLLPGPLPIKKLLDLAAQIAEGLASAHEAGIIHRDLKPANIMVSRDGFAKILDFGLAKLADLREEPEAAESKESTEKVSKTRPGALLGTVAYMSPEQVSGKRVDFRSDQFSFGALLYEMSTGRRAFRRETPIDTLVAILHEEPEPFEALNVRLPPPVRWVVERCLAKDPRERFTSTRDLARDLATLRIHLAEISGSAGAARPDGVPPGRFHRRTLVRASQVLLAIALIGGAYRLFSSRGGGSPVRLSLLPPPDSSFNFNTAAPAPAAFSPDGARLVFGARDKSGRNLLWLRSLAESAAQPLAGTEEATYPFWSADGSSIAFFAAGKLKKKAVPGGVVETLCDARDGRGGTWSQKDEILIAPDSTGPIVTVPAKGGQPRPVTREATPSSDYSHRWPSFLPDGRHFLFLRRNPAGQQDGIYLGSLDGFDRRRLLPDISDARYSPPGYLVLVRNGALVALGFNAKNLRLTDEMLLLSEHVAYHAYRWNGAFSVSGNGRLSFEAGSASNAVSLTWFDRSGRTTGTVGSPADYGGIRLSPDGKRCAMEIRDPSTGALGIWVMDLEIAAATRISSASSLNVSPTWSPDGKRIVFSSSRNGHWNLFGRDSAGAGPEELLSPSRSDQAPTAWSSDGKWIAFNSNGPNPTDKYQVWTFDVTMRESSPLIQSGYNERDGSFSSDGRYLAYVSDETGRQEVYVRPFRSVKEKWRVSSDGGSQPSWRRDGRELYYVSPDSRLMAVSAELGGDPRFGLPSALFEAPLQTSATDIGLYAARADGERFLLVAVRKGGPLGLSVVLNWLDAARR